MLTAITHAPACLATCLYSSEFEGKLQGDIKDIHTRTYRKHPGVKVALVRVLVAVALLALVLQLAGGGVPGDVLVEVHAVFTVVTPERKTNQTLSLSNIYVCPHFVL